MKDFGRESPAKWHRVQHALFLLLRHPVLKPVPSYAGLKGAEHELTTMRRFREAGARVPDIVWREGARVALGDLGKTLRAIEQCGGEKALREPALAAAAELARLHSAGLVHGRPILRNMTWDGATVGFIDFEEHAEAVMPLVAAQARDALLFLMSLGRRSGPEMVAEAYASYARQSPPAVGQELAATSRTARPFLRLLGPVLARTGNRDLLGLLRALTAIGERSPLR